MCDFCEGKMSSYMAIPEGGPMPKPPCWRYRQRVADAIAKALASEADPARRAQIDAFLGRERAIIGRLKELKP